MAPRAKKSNVLSLEYANKEIDKLRNDIENLRLDVVHQQEKIHAYQLEQITLAATINRYKILEEELRSDITALSEAHDGEAQRKLLDMLSLLQMQAAFLHGIMICELIGNHEENTAYNEAMAAIERNVAAAKALAGVK